MIRLLRILGISLLLLVLANGAAHAAISLVTSPSRTSCVAPCNVFFDARGTTGLAGSDYWNASFTWRFADTLSTHNTTIGFVASHVFETAGTYGVVTTVTDTSGASASTTTTITVTAMTGTTYYVANSGSDTNNCLSMTSPCATFSHAKNIGGLAANNSIMLRRGDTFTESVFINVTGPFLMAAYTDPNHVSAANPIFRISGGQQCLSNITGTAISIVDIHCIDDHTSISQNSIGTSVTTANVLLLRWEVEEDVVGTGSADEMLFIDQPPTCTLVTVADSHFHDFKGYGVYAAGPHSIAMIGNTIERVTGQLHGIRLSSCPSASPGVCANSESQGNGEYVAANQVLTTHNVSFDSIAIRGDTDGAVVVDNHTTQQINLTVTNSGIVEYIQHVLIDRNWITSSDATGGDIGTRLQVRSAAIRNNLFGNGNPAVQIVNASQLQTGWIDQIKVYNNSAYYPAGADSTPTGGAEFLWTDLASGTPTFTVLNNIFYDAHTSSGESWARLVSNVGTGATITEDYNVWWAPANGGFTPPTGPHDVHGNPSFSAVPPLAPADFNVASSSAAINAGTSTLFPTYDYIGTTRPQGGVVDSGAYEYVASTGSNSIAWLHFAIIILAISAASGLALRQRQRQRKRRNARQELPVDLHPFILEAIREVDQLELGEPIDPVRMLAERRKGS